MPLYLDYAQSDFGSQFKNLLSAKREDSPDVDAAVAEIIADVRARGDAALIELTEKFDRITPDPIRITSAEINEALSQGNGEDRAALQLAADRIRAYHERQLPEDVSLSLIHI